MPIVNLPSNPPHPEPIPKQNVSLTAPAYRHSVVDTQITPLQALLTHIEGSSWIGDYYSQVISADEELSEFQPNQLSAYQQLHLIKNYELKLQSSLSFSTESDTAILNITGDAIMYPGIIPNRGDTWIADIGDGRAGQFTVTNVEAKSLFKQTCYQISVQLARFIDKELIDNLNNRVVKTSYFVKDYMLYGQNPLITEEALVAKNNLEDLEKKMFNHWANFFFSTEFNTYLVPGQVGPTYDPYVTRLIFTLYNLDEHKSLIRAKLLNVDGVPHVNQKSIFDALMDRDNLLIEDVMRNANLLWTGFFNEHTLLKSIRYSGIHYVVGATNITNSVDVDYTIPFLVEGTPYKQLNDFNVNLASTIYNNVIDDFTYPGEEPLPPSSTYLDDEVPLLHSVLSTSTYIFSPDFYDNTPDGYSKIELLVKEYLNTGVVNRTVLYAICSSYREWGRMEKFYYIPVLLLLIKVAKRML